MLFAVTVPPLTVATFLLDENQLTPLVFAVSFEVLPAARVSVVGEMPVAVPFLTVSLQVPVPPSSEALITAVPAFLAVTMPF